MKHKIKNFTMYSTMRTVASILLITGSLHAALTPVDPLTAGAYTILAKSSVSTTTGSSITGNVGISAAAATYLTGFDLIIDSSGEFSTSAMVMGKLYGADYTSPTPDLLTQAVSDMEAAYTDAAGRANPDFSELSGGELGGETLTAGLYKWTSALNINSSLTLDAEGDSSAVWIFQVQNRLSLASSASIFLTGGANVGNIFWQTAEGATLGTNSHFEGVILTMTDVAGQAGASMNGRLLAQTAVTLDSNNVQAVPEPASFAILAGLSVLGLNLVRRKR